MFKYIRKVFGFYKTNESGAAGVEFALIAIPFLLMIFGVMEAGRIMWIMNSVQYSVEETSRYASLNSNLPEGEFQTYAENILNDMFVPSSELRLSSSTVTSNGIDFVSIDASYTISLIVTGLLPNDLGVFDYDTVVRKPIIN